MHMAVNTTKAIGVKGVKGWVSASENVAKIANKAGTKVTAVAAGRAVLNAEANGTKYRIDLFAEDLSIKGDKEQRKVQVYH